MLTLPHQQIKLEAEPTLAAGAREVEESGCQTPAPWDAQCIVRPGKVSWLTRGLCL